MLVLIRVLESPVGDGAPRTAAWRLKPTTCLAVLALAGCIENDVKGNPRASLGAPTECDAVDWQQAIVPMSAACTHPPVDWNLQLRWSWDRFDQYLTPHVGRYADGDGDGLITAADPVGVWLTPFGVDGPNHFLLDSEGTPVWEGSEWGDAYRVYATVGEVDPEHAGMEYILGDYVLRDQSYAIAASADSTLYTTATGGEHLGGISLVDLDADGAPEVLWERLVTSGRDGHAVFAFEGVGGMNASADLDLDGLPEILTTDGLEPTVLDHTGHLLASCPVPITSTDSSAENTVFAIGNLDDDPEGEFAVANARVLAICEVDGTLVRSVTTLSDVSDVLGLAELDGDALPEIVLKYDADDTTTGIAAYDTDLTLLWETIVGETHLPFALADLDGDGLHEVVVSNGHGLSILGPEGGVRAEVDGPLNGNSRNAPIITDLDGDGLAEIIVTGASPNVAVYDNDQGGWAVNGAEDPWPGTDHFPGDRTLDGALPDPGDVHWLVPGHNVWQGLAAGAPPLPSLGVSIEDACASDCDAILFTVYVFNSGSAGTLGALTVGLYRLDDGALLGTQTLAGPLDRGVSMPVQFDVATSVAGSGVRAVVNLEDGIAECTDVPNEAVLTELPCR